MLLDRGMKWQQLNITPEDAQMLESRKFSGEEICRIFGVPPAMVGYGDKSSNWGTGKEVDVLGFQKFTLRRRLKRVEQAVQKQLLTAADRVAGITIEFNMEALLRGESEARARFYQTMTQIGAYTSNEVRALENLPPVPGGDVSRMQMQNVPITEAGQEEQ
jgi:HK97 family phage portal protein